MKTVEIVNNEWKDSNNEQNESRETKDKKNIKKKGSSIDDNGTKETAQEKGTI